MPDLLAHCGFARGVLGAVAPALRARIDADSLVFFCGAFGPDPLFNDPRSAGRALGHGMHNMPGRVSLERMRAPVHEQLPWAAEYAAGFFCHYALDRLCHPLINAMAARGPANHVAIEVAYERMLSERGDRADPSRNIRLSPEQLEVIVTMYPGISPNNFRSDVRTYALVRRFLRCRGSSCLAWLPKHIHPEWDGFIPYSEPSAGTLQATRTLDERISASVGIAAEQLTRYFAAIDASLPLDPWTDADFNGRFGGERAGM